MIPPSDNEGIKEPEGTAVSGCGRRPRQALAGSLGLSYPHISPSSNERAIITFYNGARLTRLKMPSGMSVPAKNPEQRGEVIEFSKASQRRLMDLFASLRTDCLPHLVTLTYPDQFPLYRKEYKRHMDTLGKRIRRRWPNSAIIWKLEFKKRLSGENKGGIAPHYHLFIFNVPLRFVPHKEINEWYTLKQTDPDLFELEVLSKTTEPIEASYLFDPEDKIHSDTLKYWFSRNWYDIVGTGDHRNYLAGTRVEEIRSHNGSMWYAAQNYSRKMVDCSELAETPGRFWGVKCRTNLPVGYKEEREIPIRTGIKVKRQMRGYLEHKLGKRCRNRSSLFSGKIYGDPEIWKKVLTLYGSGY